MRRAVFGLVWLSATAAVVGFVQPWAFIDVREPGAMRSLRSAAPANVGRVMLKIRRGAETLTGELPTLADLPRQVSGIQIPRMVRETRAQVAVAVLELLTKTRHHLGAKSYLVYLVPGIALSCAAVLTAVSAPGAAIGVGLLSAAIAGIGFWQVMTTRTDSLFVAIRIGPGLWLSLWAYVGLAASAAGLAAIRPGRAD